MEQKEHLNQNSDALAQEENSAASQEATIMQDTNPSTASEADSASEVAPEDDTAKQSAQEATPTTDTTADGSHDEEAIEDIVEEESVDEAALQATNMEGLLLQLEQIVEEKRISNTKNVVSALRLVFDQKLNTYKEEKKAQYEANGGDPEQYKAEEHPLDRQFRHIFGKYKQLRRQQREEQEQIKVANLDKKKGLLEEMRVLIASEEKLKDIYDKFTDIQNQWREIGMVPQGDVQTLWNNYHFLVEKFFDKVKINKELRDLDLKKNLSAKLALCEQAEELLLDNSINNSFKKLQEYHNEWKGIGPVPSANNDEIWERFKTASDKINERRRAHYEEVQKQFEENYASKQALCAKAEDLLISATPDSAKAWNKSTEQMEELLKVWKTLGPAPRQVNDEIWKTFRGHMDNFYTQRKQYFNGLKAEQKDNYQRKLDLVKQAEALKDSTDWGNTSKTLIKLQETWKKIGPVPRKHSDEIWKQFRAANDAFFQAKSEHFKGQTEVEKQNLAAKKALVEEIEKAEFGDDKKANLDIIKAFQRRWTELGRVPRKDMDTLYKSYRGALDKHMEALDISGVDFRNAGFKDHIASLKQNDNSESALRRERSHLQRQLDKLKEDILLWENNMGFFRHSKNADVLRSEFEKKIKTAKADMLVLREKIRLIDK